MNAAVDEVEINAPILTNIWNTHKHNMHARTRTHAMQASTIGP